MRRLIAALLGVLAVTAVAACTSTSVPGNTPPGPSPQGAIATSSAPQRVLATLAQIDAGTWPPHDGSGTHGGTRFTNREGRLPKSANGRAVTYTEWDVNEKKSGHSRDAERIITGSDHSAWYTLDHYQTFSRIR